MLEVLSCRPPITLAWGLQPSRMDYTEGGRTTRRTSRKSGRCLTLRTGPTCVFLGRLAASR